MSTLETSIPLSIIKSFESNYKRLNLQQGVCVLIERATLMGCPSALLKMIRAWDVQRNSDLLHICGTSSTREFTRLDRSLEH